MLRGLIASLLITVMSSVPVRSEDVPAADGDTLADCYGAYDALVALADAKKLPEALATQYTQGRQKAEDRAIPTYAKEGIDEETAKGQLAVRGEYMRSELRDLHEGSGIYSADEVRTMADGCNALIGT
jgi:hypothetical protein